MSTRRRKFFLSCMYPLLCAALEPASIRCSNVISQPFSYPTLLPAAHAQSTNAVDASAPANHPDLLRGRSLGEISTTNNLSERMSLNLQRTLPYLIGRISPSNSSKRDERRLVRYARSTCARLPTISYQLKALISAQA